MELTSAQLKKLTKDQVIDEYLKFSEIFQQMKTTNSKVDEGLQKFEVMNSELSIVKNCINLLM